MLNLENTYWNHNGKFDDLNNALHKIIDDKITDVKFAKNNPKLEKLRKAKHYYYRFFNDGDLNALVWYSYTGKSIGYNKQSQADAIEAALDKLIFEAAEEQNLIGEADIFLKAGKAIEKYNVVQAPAPTIDFMV